MSRLASIDWRTASENFFAKIAKIKRKHRLLISFGSILLLGGGFFGLVYMPKSEEIANATETVSQLEQKLRTVKIHAKSLEKFREDHVRVQKEFQEALKLLPDKREIPDLLRGISQRGINAKLEFRLFSPKPENPKDFYMEIPVDMEVSGEYRNVIDFFDRIGRMDRIVNILNITMKPDKPLSTSLITRCMAITYRFKGKDDVKEEQQKKKKGK